MTTKLDDILFIRHSRYARGLAFVSRRPKPGYYIFFANVGAELAGPFRTLSEARAVRRDLIAPAS